MFLTPAQIAAKYPVSKSTVYGACQAGFLPFYRLPSRRGTKGKYLIKESDFLAWLESNRYEAPGEGQAPPPRAATPLKHLKLS